MANYFDPKTAAVRYAKGRPYHQDVVITRVRNFLQIDGKLSAAADVGCGTGLSCVALTDLAERVVGTDISGEMLAEAPSHPAIEYLHCPAEELAVPAAEFDILTVSSAFHWFDRAAFLKEASRVLRGHAWMVIYNNGFGGMKVDGFNEWNQETYVKTFPSPPRNSLPFTDEEAIQAGFQFLGKEKYQNSVRWGKESFIDYLVTQSNVIAVVENGTRGIDEVREFLSQELIRFFPAQNTMQTFGFGGPIWYLQHLDASSD